MGLDGMLIMGTISFCVKEKPEIDPMMPAQNLPDSPKIS